jgi:D-sedoheptulose 7-phosphate isomerase
MLWKESTMHSMNLNIRTYFAELQEMIANLPIDLIDRAVIILLDSARQEKKVFIFGNGGSAATASHFACDLAKNTQVANAPYFRVIALNDNMATLTAYANDTGYDNIFAAQLVSLVGPGDVVIGISCSGNSANVLRAFEVARQRGAIVIGLTGDRGGQLKNLVDLCIQAPSPRIEQQEDAHLIIEHCICATIRQQLMAMFEPYKLNLISSQEVISER